VHSPAFRARNDLFERNGGTTGFRNLYMTGEEHAKEIEQMLHPSKFQASWAGKGGKAVLDWLTDYNSAFENSVRLAVFEAALAEGVPPVKAASMAKDVTVNFNRKGTYSRQMGALYAFFNVSVQSLERASAAMFSHKDGKTTLTNTGKKVILGGMLLGGMQTASLAMFGFDAEEPPEFIKARSIIIPAPFTEKGYIAVPMPFIFNIAPNAGRLIIEALIFGDLSDKAQKFLMAVMDSTDPLGGSSTIAQELTPSVLDPFVALIENTDWQGKHIYREDFNASKPTPGHSRAKQNASDWALGLSRVINQLTLGSEFAAGAPSYPPEVFESLAEHAFGGPGRLFTKATRLTKELSEGDPIHLYNIPLVGKLIGAAGGDTSDWAKWSKNMSLLHIHNLELKGREDDREARREYMDSHPLARRVEDAKISDRTMKNLLTERRKIRGQDRTAQLDKQRERIDERISHLLTSFNERVEAVVQ